MNVKVVKGVVVVVAVAVVAFAAVYAMNAGTAGKADKISKTPQQEDPHGSGEMMRMMGGGEDMFDVWLSNARDEAKVELMEKPAPGGAVAVVNGVKIAEADYRKRLDLKRKMLSGMSEHGEKSGVSESDLEKIQKQLIDQMIGEELVRQEAGKRGVGMTEKELDAMMKEKIEAVGGREQMDELLKQHGMTESDIKDNLARETLRGRLRKAVMEEMGGMHEGGSGGASPHGESPHGSVEAVGGTASPHGAAQEK